MYKICFYVPESHLEQVKNAIFSEGAGKIGDYERCCWQVLGEGQFKPVKGSAPFIGTQGVEEKIPEYKVELVCDDENIKMAVQSLLSAHPYEEPAYDVIKIENIGLSS